MGAIISFFKGNTQNQGVQPTSNTTNNKKRSSSNNNMNAKIKAINSVNLKDLNLDYELEKIPISNNLLGLKVLVLSFNTEAINIKNSRINSDFSMDIKQIFSTNNGNIDFLVGNNSSFKKPSKYIRSLLNKIGINENSKEFMFPDMITVGLQESSFSNDISFIILLFELNKMILVNKNIRNKNNYFYSLYCGGEQRIGQTGKRGNRLGILVKSKFNINKVQTEIPKNLKDLKKHNCDNQFQIEYKDSSRSQVGGESTITQKVDNSKRILNYTYNNSKDRQSIYFICDSSQYARGLQTKIQSQKNSNTSFQEMVTKSNNFSYFIIQDVNKNISYKFNVFNLHLTFNRDVEDFGLSARTRTLKKAYKNMYIDGSNLIIMGDLNFRFKFNKDNQIIDELGELLAKNGDPMVQGKTMPILKNKNRNKIDFAKMQDLVLKIIKIKKNNVFNNQQKAQLIKKLLNENNIDLNVFNNYVEEIINIYTCKFAKRTSLLDHRDEQYVKTSGKCDRVITQINNVSLLTIENEGIRGNFREDEVVKSDHSLIYTYLLVKN